MGDLSYVWVTTGGEKVHLVHLASEFEEGSREHPVSSTHIRNITSRPWYP